MAGSGGSQGTLLGATLGGYRVESLIGRGAMGTVYLARDTKLNRPVALKVLLGSLARTPSVVKQFHLEAQAAAPLKHPGIVRIYSAGIEHGTPFIAMEYVEGEPLDRFLRRTGRLKWEHAFQIGAQVALALDCAHRNGVVHRDVKPSNIMLDKSGRVRLADFGIANIHTEEQGGSTAQAIIGTPQYMSPEQCTGGAVEAPSDLFALGVILYQMIAGELPFQGESSMALVKAICTEDPPRLNERLPDVPDDVARCVAYLLEKNPRRRPENARAAHRRLVQVQEHEGGHSAIPEALTAFIQEEMEPRSANDAQEKRKKGGKRRTPRPKKGDGEGNRTLPWKAVARVAAVVLLAVAAFAAPFVSKAIAGHQPAEPLPELQIGAFRDLAGGAVAVDLQLAGYAPADVAWSAEGDRLLVVAQGVEGGLTEGAQGVLVIDPAARTVKSLVTPVGPGFDPASVNQPPPEAHLPAAMPRLPETSPLAGALPVVIGSGRNTAVLPQRITAASPEPRVLAQFTEAAHGSLVIERAVPHPGGDLLGLALREGRSGSVYIAEQRLGVRPRRGLGPPLTTEGRAIVPESITYSPNGRRIAYARRSGTDYELWVTASGGDAGADRRVAESLATPRVAFDPKGQLLAATTQDRESGLRVSFFRVDDGTLEAYAALGTIARACWNTETGELIGPRVDDESGSLRTVFWSVHPGEEGAGERVATVYGEHVREYAVAPDGTWLAAITSEPERDGAIRLMPLAPELQ